MTETDNTPAVQAVSEADKSTIFIVYVAAIVSALLSFIPFLAILGIIVWIGLLIFCYIKKGDTQSAGAISHYSNFITVFWIGLVATVVAILFMITLVLWILGIIVMIATFAWEAYRLIKGLVRVMDHRAYD